MFWFIGIFVTFVAGAIIIQAVDLKPKWAWYLALAVLSILAPYTFLLLGAAAVLLVIASPFILITWLIRKALT